MWELLFDLDRLLDGTPPHKLASSFATLPRESEKSVYVPLPVGER
jgi:hypothetical protein